MSGTCGIIPWTRFGNTIGLKLKTHFKNDQCELKVENVAEGSLLREFGAAEVNDRTLQSHKGDNVYC